MKTSLKERKYVEMHVSILESGDGGTIKENIARGGIFMRDQEITELFWERKEQAVTESNIRYGAYCRRISYNILANKEWYLVSGVERNSSAAPIVFKSIFRENYSQSFSQPLEVGSGRKTDSTRSNACARWIRRMRVGAWTARGRGTRRGTQKRN